MLVTNLFMLVWGIKLVQTTWFQSIAEFPIVSAGMAYLPIPIGGALTTLFVIERLLTQEVLRGARARDRSARSRPSSGGAMDVLILVGSFTIVCLMGMPVAYALGLAAILGALWTDIPLEAVMLKVSGGMSGFSLLAIPFFILCGAIMAVGGMAERLVNLAKVFVGFIRGGMALVNIVASTMFGCISGSSVADTAAVGCGDDPADDQERLSAAVRGQCHDLRLAAAPAAAAVAQHDHLFARRRRHHLGRAPVHGAA